MKILMTMAALLLTTPTHAGVIVGEAECTILHKEVIADTTISSRDQNTVVQLTITRTKTSCAFKDTPNDKMLSDGLDLTMTPLKPGPQKELVYAGDSSFGFLDHKLNIVGEKHGFMFLSDKETSHFHDYLIFDEQSNVDLDRLGGVDVKIGSDFDTSRIMFKTK